MKILRAVFIFFAVFSSVSLCQIDVGTGAPDEAIRLQFVRAYSRGGFAYLVSMPPQGQVTTYGTTGLIQRFSDAAKSGGTLALVKGDRTDVVLSGLGVCQVSAAMYAYYNSVGSATAGYPVNDTINCPPGPNSCQYQLFNKPYALFTYAVATVSGQNFATRDPYYTKWSNAGGIGSMGPATSAETAVKSSVSAIAATVQTYSSGAIFNITSGTLAGRLVLVPEPAYDAYVANNQWTGYLGLPTSDALGAAGGHQTQTFEGGTLEWDPGQGATLRLAVAGLSITPTTGPFNLNLGDSVTLQASGYDRNGNTLAGRTVSWSSSNSRVVSIQASGGTAVLKAVGGGTAIITASSEGKVSLPITVYVTAPCCQVGEGAPSSIIQQTFLDAVTRDNLQFQLPAASPVVRMGNGYVQEFLSASNPPVRYVLAKPDQISVAYYLTGPILNAYESMGGETGSLGYPTTDPSATGRQVFQNGALAGNPVQLVAGDILAKWASLGYETGSAGSPASPAATFLSFGGSSGTMQAFVKGKIYAASLGPQANKAFFVGGVVAAGYDAAGGVTGSLGMPTTDEYATGGIEHQGFEGGYIEYAAGSTNFQTVVNPRRPAVSAAPGTVTAGSQVRYTVSGFKPGANLRVSITGQPDFVVNVQNGSYVWAAYVPSSAATGPVTVAVVDMGGTDSATASYTVTSAAQATLQMVKLRGDNQTGAPGTQLTQSLQVALRDNAGNAIVGVAVQFAASPGATISPAAAVTDQNGQAEAVLRLPPTEGIARATATALRQVTTFSELSSQFSLASFPSFTAASAQNGALLTSAAAILRYHQNRGELNASAGLADPDVLNKFLQGVCVFNVQGGSICDGFLQEPQSGNQVVNLWRLGAFVSGALDISVEQPDLNTVRDLVAAGSPVLLVLSMTSGGAPAGANYVVATGIGTDGGIQIFDPNPSFGRTSLNDYLQGFATDAGVWQATLTGAVRVLLHPPKANSFLITAGKVSFEVTSPVGVCGRTLEIPDGTGVFRMRYCDGFQPTYQLDILETGPSAVRLTDLANPGSLTDLANSGAASYKLARPAAQWTAVPQTPAFSANAVVNAASFTSSIAPGGLISIFGSGLARAGAITTADIRGVPLQILAASPFQLNAQVPFALVSGTYPLRIHSPYGDTQQLVTLLDTAPAIFQTGPQQAAIVNQDGTLNSPTQPAPRGKTIVIYGTGFGAVTASGKLSVTQTPVTAVIQGVALPVAFAGLTPGFVGLYQVNVLVPASIAPDLDASLVLKQGSALSNGVMVAIQ